VSVHLREGEHPEGGGAAAEKDARGRGGGGGGDGGGGGGRGRGVGVSRRLLGRGVVGGNGGGDAVVEGDEVVDGAQGREGSSQGVPDGARRDVGLLGDDTRTGRRGRRRRRTGRERRAAAAARPERLFERPAEPGPEPDERRWELRASVLLGDEVEEGEGRGVVGSRWDGGLERG